MHLCLLSLFLCFVCINALYVVQEGNLYNTDDGRKALRDIFALNLFENVQVGWNHLCKHLAWHCRLALHCMPFLSSLHCSPAEPFVMLTPAVVQTASCS